MPRRLARFGFVGALGFAVDAGVLLALTAGAGLDAFAARAIAIATAVACTWVLNRTLTFRMPSATPAELAREGGRYGVVAALSAGLNWLVYAVMLLAVPGLPPLAALALASATAMAFSYLGYAGFAFRR